MRTRRTVADQVRVGQPPQQIRVDLLGEDVDEPGAVSLDA